MARPACQSAGSGWLKTLIASLCPAELMSGELRKCALGTFTATIIACFFQLSLLDSVSNLLLHLPPSQGAAASNVPCIKMFPSGDIELLRHKVERSRSAACLLPLLSIQVENVQERICGFVFPVVSPSPVFGVVSSGGHRDLDDGLFDVGSTDCVVCSDGFRSGSG